MLLRLGVSLFIVGCLAAGPGALAGAQPGTGRRFSRRMPSSALRYVKDNRLLPEGFDKRSAPKDVAVHGDALAT